MNELERRIEVLEHRLKEKQVEINIADEIHFDELKDCRFWNGVLICLVISMALWIATT